MRGSDEIWLAGGEAGSPSNSFFINYGFNPDGSLTFFEGSFSCCGPDPTRDFGNRDLHFLRPGYGWVVGGGGQITRWTGDRFRPSESQTSNTSQALNGIHMLEPTGSFSDTIGWIVGNGGTILKTFNGGANWTAQTSGTTANLRDVSFLDAQRGWAVGDGGVILATSDGGNTWLQEFGAGTTDLRSVHFMSSSAGFAVGANGAILRRVEAATATSVSAASYSPTGLAAESIAAVFGAGLATTTQSATTIPLPTTLAGTQVKVRDSAGVEREAPLFFVSPNQVNYQIPADTAAGTAAVTVTSGDGKFATGTMQVATVAPGLFAANSDGQGVPAGYALRVTADSSQSFEPVAQFEQNKFVPAPLDLGPETDQVFLILFGAGIHYRSSLSAVTAKIGGMDAEVLYAGAQGGFVGLDQINVRLPRTLAGRGEVDVVVAVDGKVANTLRIHIR